MAAEKITVLEKRQGTFNNLMAQFNKVYSETCDLRSKTDRTYASCVTQFIKYCANEFNLQKFDNIKEKHVEAFIREMKNLDFDTGRIKTTLSGIQRFQELTGSKNRLLESSKILKRCGIENRIEGKVDRAASNVEKNKVIDLAKAQGRYDIVYSVKLSSNFGLRIEGVTTIKVSQIEAALKNGYLHVKEKGGLERDIPIDSTSQQKTLFEIKEFCNKNGLKKNDKIFVDGSKFLNPNLIYRNKDTVTKAQKRIQKWIKKNRGEFEDKDRKDKDVVKEAKKEGIIEKEHITFHSFRHHYARKVYTKLRREGYGEKPAMRKTAELLGHGRYKVTKIYLACKQAEQELQGAA